MSNPSSIFSLQSIQSTFLTTDTHFTADEMCTAIDELVSIFMDDKELAPLYREAIFERCIAPPQVVRNFKQLLKQFAVQLKEEAQEAIHIGLANFVASRACLVAAKIGSKCEQQHSQLGPTSTQPQGIQVENEAQAHLNKDFHDMSSDDEDESEPERAHDEKFAALVSQSRSFIEKSTAFQKLREEFKNFVIPPKVNWGLSAEPYLEFPSWFQRCAHSVSSKSLDLELKNEAQGWIIKAHLDLKRILSSVGLLEGSVTKNHQRFRWTSVGLSICYPANLNITNA